MPVSISNENKGATGFSKEVSGSFFALKKGKIDGEAAQSKVERAPNLTASTLLKGGATGAATSPLWVRLSAFAPATLLQYLLRGGKGRNLTPKALNALQKQFEATAEGAALSKTFSQYGSSESVGHGVRETFLKNALSVALAEKNLIFNNDTLAEFMPFLFGTQNERPSQGEAWIQLFNQSQGKGEGLDWKIFPFDFGSVVIGLNQGHCDCLNINWLHEGRPETIHLDVVSKRFLFGGHRFVSTPGGPLERKVAPILKKLGYARGGAPIDEGGFDGFCLYPPLEAVAIEL